MLVKVSNLNQSYFRRELTFVVLVDRFPSAPLRDGSLVVVSESFFRSVGVKAQPNFFYVRRIGASSDLFVFDSFSEACFQFGTPLFGAGGCHLKKVRGYERSSSSLHQKDCGSHLMCDSCDHVSSQKAFS